MAQKALTIIFDLDGTLTDVESRHYFVYSKIVKELGGRSLPKDIYWKLKRASVTWPDILVKSQISLAQRDEFMQSFIELIENPEMLNIDKLFPNVKKTLEKLSDYDCYLISLRRHEDRVKSQLKKLGIEKYFKEILAGHTEGEGYELKIKLMSSLINPNQTVVIGDTETDIKAAQHLKYTAVAVSSGLRSGDTLKSLSPDFLISDISELLNLIPKIETTY